MMFTARRGALEGALKAAVACCGKPIPGIDTGYLGLCRISVRGGEALITALDAVVIVRAAIRLEGDSEDGDATCDPAELLRAIDGVPKTAKPKEDPIDVIQSADGFLSIGNEVGSWSSCKMAERWPLAEETARKWTEPGPEALSMMLSPEEIEKIARAAKALGSKHVYIYARKEKNKPIAWEIADEADPLGVDSRARGAICPMRTSKYGK